MTALKDDFLVRTMGLRSYLRGVLREDGMTEAKLRERASAYNQDKIKPPLDRRELNKAVRMALKPPEEAQTPEKKVRVRLGIQELEKELRSRGFGVQYNMIKACYETTGKTDAGRVPSFDDLATILHDQLADEYRGATFDTISQKLLFIARENQYNPVLECLDALQWDGQDRRGQLFSMLGLEHDTLSQALVWKWLLQSVALLFNDEEDPFGADGCLVLNGEQGLGKTSFFRHLALRSEWFGEGQRIDDRDKDTGRRAITVWICELGEVESTMKSDIPALRAFVTSSEDHYRLPYGRNDIVAPRRTSLCATANDDRYLVDPTGNRRWWSVPFRRAVSHEELKALDAQQLWAQIYAQVAPLSYEDKKTCFRLTADEQKQLSKRNGSFEKPLKSQPEVEDILSIAKRDNLQMREMTVAEFKALWPTLAGYDTRQIGIALKHLGINGRQAHTGRFVVLPVPSSK